MYAHIQQSGSDDLADAGTFLIGVEVEGAGIAMDLSWLSAFALDEKCQSNISIESMFDVLERIGMGLPLATDFNPDLDTLVDILCPALVVNAQL